MQHSKKLLAMLLVLCMIIGFVPLSAQAALLDGADYITQQLSLNEDLVLHLRGNIPDNYKDGSTAVLTYGDTTEEYTISEMTPDEDGLYDLPVEMAMAEMTENINLVLKMGSIEAINEDYSVAAYLKSLIDGNYGSNTKTLAKELLNYGANAQQYFNHNTDSLANAGYEIESLSYPIGDGIPQMEYTGAVSGVVFYGVSVRFTSKAAVRYYFNIDGDISTYTFTVDGVEYEPVSKDGRYYIEVTGVGPKAMSTSMNVAVTDGTDTLSFYYNPICYFQRNYHNTSDETFKNLMLAAYSYYKTADVYQIGTGDFLEGIDFEVAENELWFTGVGGDNEWRDATFAVEEFDGDNALKMTCAASQWPTFRINFGKTLKAGTVLTFDAYTNDTSGIRTTVSIFEYVSGGEATAQYYHGSWNTLTITLAEATDHIDLVCNMDRWNEPGSANLEVYMDNFKAVEPVEISGSFIEGIDFETAGNELWFTGVGGDNEWRDATFAVEEFDGDNALKLTCAASQWPTFRINFEKTLAAGTVLTFDAYTNDTSGIRNTVSIFEYVSGGEATAQYYHGSWNTLTITLAEETDHIDLMCNMDRWNEPGSANIEIYMDNFKAVEPVVEAEPVGDFTQGIDFETEGNELWFTGVGGDNEWRDATFAVTEFDGDNALKLTCAASQWPTFRINFNKTLAAGTVLTFDAYTNDTSGIRTTVSIFEYVSGGEATAQYYHGSWNTLTITLAEETDHIDLMCNMDRWNEPGSANIEIYMDNFKAVEPVQEEDEDADIIAGITFENNGHTASFTGTGASQDATIERVSYADAGITNDNGSDYALKLSHSSHYYPTFQLNFGQTLPADTVITFDVYGSFDGWAEGNDMNIELTGDSGSGQIAYMLPGGWYTASVTLASDCDHLQFFYNIERNNGISGDVASYIIIDNIKAVKADLTFVNGIAFDNSTDINYFTGVGGDNAWRDATLEIAEYDGDNALKLTCAASQWPTFRINLGKTYDAGAILTFDAYTNDTSGIRTTVSIFEYVSGGEATVQYYHGSWNGLSIKLTEDCSYIDLMCNMDRWNEPGSANLEVYLDNFVITEAISNGTVDFEVATDANNFTGTGASQDATIERVAYEDLDITAVENGGDYALKLSHSSHYYPTFQLNFGETLAAGTTITFKVYGSFDGWAEGNDMNIELTGDSGSGQIAYMLPEGWYTASVTLASDCDHLQFFYNIERNNGISGDVASYIIIDNIQVG